MPRKMSRRARVEMRQLRVAELLVENKSYRQIAADLHVSDGTVSRDVAALRKEWGDRRVELVDSKAAEDLIRSDIALGAMIGRVRTDGLRPHDPFVQLLDYRARVLGLYNQRPETSDIAAAFNEALARLESQAAELPENDPGAALEH